MPRLRCRQTLGGNHHVSNPLVAPEQFVAADAAEQHLDARLSCRLGHGVMTEGGRIGDRLVEKADESGEFPRKLVNWDFDLVERHAQRLRQSPCVVSFVVGRPSRITDREGVHSGWGIALRNGGDRARIDAA